MTPKDHRRWIALAFITASLLPCFSTFGQGTAFTYQGWLTAAGQAANGSYDMKFGFFNAANGGAQVGATVTNLATGVSNGVFTVTLDFGPAPYNGQPLWLQIAVSPAGSNTFTTLSPLQPLTSTPYSVQSLNAGTAAHLTGPITLAQLPGMVVTNGASNVAIAGTFTGNGSGLTNLSGSALPSVVVTNTETGVTLSGTFSGNGSGLTNLSLSALPSNVVTVIPTPIQTNVYAVAGVTNFVIPAGVTQIIAKMWGAGGGGADGRGGGGAFVQKTISVTPGQTITIVIGQHGNYNNSSAGGAGSGDASGGGVGTNMFAAQGGQASSLFVASGSSYVLQAVAGGGGGGGGANGTSAPMGGDGGAGGNPGQQGSFGIIFTNGAFQPVSSGGAGGGNGSGGGGGTSSGTAAGPGGEPAPAMRQMAPQPASRILIWRTVSVAPAVPP